MDDVGRFGWHGISVCRCEGCDGPEFYFTIGLGIGHRHPELVIVGLTGEQSHAIAQSAIADIRGGHVFAAGTRSDALLEGYDVRFEAVDVDAWSEWLQQAHWFYGDEPWSVLQVIWPDRNGHFPGDADYDDVASPQQVLS